MKRPQMWLETSPGVRRNAVGEWFLTSLYTLTQADRGLMCQKNSNSKQKLQMCRKEVVFALFFGGIPTTGIHWGT